MPCSGAAQPFGRSASSLPNPAHLSKGSFKACKDPLLLRINKDRSPTQTTHLVLQWSEAAATDEEVNRKREADVEGKSPSLQSGEYEHEGAENEANRRIPRFEWSSPTRDMAIEFYTKHLNAAGTRLTAFLYGLSSTGSVADVAQKLAELPAPPIDLPVLRGWLARFIIVSIGGADRDPGPDFMIRVAVPGVDPRTFLRLNH